MVQYFVQFQSTLKKNFDEDPLEMYLQVREKTHIYLFLEIMIRRIDA